MSENKRIEPLMYSMDIKANPDKALDTFQAHGADAASWGDLAVLSVVGVTVAKAVTKLRYVTSFAKFIPGPIGAAMSGFDYVLSHQPVSWVVGKLRKNKKMSDVIDVIEDVTGADLDDSASKLDKNIQKQETVIHCQTVTIDMTKGVNALHQSVYDDKERNDVAQN